MKLIKCELSGRDAGRVILNMDHIVSIEEYADFTILIKCINGLAYFICSDIDTFFHTMKDEDVACKNNGIDFIDATFDQY